MNKYLNNPVAYLQDSDFDSNGNIKNPVILNSGKPVVIMIQANFCGYCTQAKPDFQNFADKNRNKVFCATIQGDGNEPGEKELSKRIDSIKPGFQGFPDYVLYRNGRRVDKEINGRDVKNLENFVK